MIRLLRPSLRSKGLRILKIHVLTLETDNRPNVITRNGRCTPPMIIPNKSACVLLSV